MPRHSRIPLLLFIILPVLFLSGCGMDDVMSWTSGRVSSDQREIDSYLNDPYGEHGRPVDGGVYYDEVTGLHVSRAQYYANHVTDAVKIYGWYIALPSFVLGFFIRRLVHSSASVRKLGLFLELWVPFIYVLIAFVLSAVADKIR